jgi:hypothetical protein
MTLSEINHKCECELATVRLRFQAALSVHEHLGSGSPEKIPWPLFYVEPQIRLNLGCAERLA